MSYPLNGHISNLFVNILRTLSSDFFKKITETVITRTIVVAIGMLVTIMVARLLGPEGRGLYAVAITIGTIGIQIGNLGQPAAITYRVAKNPKLLSALLGNSLFISFFFGTIIIIIIGVITTIMPSVKPVSEPLFTISLIWIPFGLSYFLLQKLIIGINEIRSYNVIEFINKLLTASFISIAFFVQFTSVEFVLSSTVIATIICFFLTLKTLWVHLNESVKIDFLLFKQNFWLGIKAYLANIFGFLVLKMDLIMLKYLSDPESTGYYSISVAMGDLLYILPATVGMILFPKLSAIHDEKNKWLYAVKTIFTIGFISIVILIVSALFAEKIITIMFGTIFLPALPAFLWLLPGIFFLSVNTIFMYYFASTGMPLITVISSGIGALFNFILNLSFIPDYGIIGAALSSDFTYGMMFIFSIIYISFKKKQFRHDDTFQKI